MKLLKLIFIGIVLLLTAKAGAQVSLSVTIGSPPRWGPSGYTEVRYYYLPDVEAYYDIQTSMFIYYGGGAWIHRTYLPRRYSNYDLYSGYKVVMVDYRGETPYTNFREYKSKYQKGYKGGVQKTIGLKPAKANSKAKINTAAKPGSKAVSPGKSKSVAPAAKEVSSPAIHKSMKKDAGQSGTNGKKK